LKLQFAIDFFSESEREERERERREAMRERRKKRVSYNLKYTQRKKSNCKLNYLRLSFLLREKRERRRG
jgi:hypothetical protein